MHRVRQVKIFFEPGNCTFGVQLQNTNAPFTLLIPNYTLYQGGGVWSSGPPTISSTLGCTNVKFCKVLEIPFKVSENTRFVENLLYGYHCNRLITWCFPLIIVKTIMKNR